MTNKQLRAEVDDRIMVNWAFEVNRDTATIW